MDKLLDRLDKRYVKICLYAGVTILLVWAAINALQMSLPVFAKIWELFCAVVEPMVYGAALSYVMNPLVKAVSHRLHKYPRFAEDPMRRRGVAVIVSVILVVLLLLAILTLFVLMITHSIQNLEWERLQALLGDAQGDFIAFLGNVEAILADWGIISVGSGSSMMDTFNDVKNVTSTAIFAVVFGIYFLIDGPRVARYAGRILHALIGDRIPLNHQGVLQEFDRLFAGYFRGQAIDALVVGVTSGAVLTVIGVPFAPVVGLLAGLGNLIPYVGGPVGFGSIALMCLPSADWGTMLWGFLAMGVIMFVDANVINPKLLSDNVEVHPILVVAALIAGGAVGGLAGMLVAVPVAAFVKQQVDRWLKAREA